MAQGRSILTEREPVRERLFSIVSRHLTESYSCSRRRKAFSFRLSREFNIDSFSFYFLKDVVVLLIVLLILAKEICLLYCLPRMCRDTLSSKNACGFELYAPVNGSLLSLTQQKRNVHPRWFPPTERTRPFRLGIFESRAQTRCLERRKIREMSFL